MRIKEESWDLTSADIIAIPAANRANGIANVWSDIWKYQVPVGQSLILKPEHHLSVHLRDTTMTEVDDGTCQIKLVMRDQSLQEEIPIYSPALYIDSKEFRDTKKKATLALTQPRTIPELFWLILAVKDKVAVSEANSYFRLETIRIRQTI